MTLVAPFPWFGGKRRVASLVWERFGDPANYVEPFAGSLAVLLARPTPARVETVNDKDAFLCNFWRATQADPDAVARAADWPISEADLHARHSWLINQGRPIVDRLIEDPDFFDARIAGWWVWGQCMWIGSGWCKPIGARHSNGTRKATDWKVRPDLSAAHGRGEIQRRGKRQIPSLSGDNSGSGRGMLRNQFVEDPAELVEYFHALRRRLRAVRVTCGDWSRVVSPAVTTAIGATGVFLDPPYSHEERIPGLYSEDSDISSEVRAWAIANGDNPKLRIALCGYEGEHVMPDSWECVAWKTSGGYGSRTERGQENATRERIWFSPRCLTIGQSSLSL